MTLGMLRPHAMVRTRLRNRIATRMTHRDIELIVLDLDGTLLDDRRRVPARNIAAVRAAHAAGVKVVLCSGRMLPNMQQTHDRLGLDLVLGGYNGAKVVDTQANGRQVIFHRPISAVQSEAIATTAAACGWLVNFYHEDRLLGHYQDRHRWLIELYQRRGGVRYEFVCPEEVNGLPSTKMIVLAHPDEIPLVVRELDPHLRGLSWVKSDPEYVEIMADGVHKGAALKAIAAHYGVELEACMAIGDASNDREMLATAGLGVAMANASEETLAAADVVLDLDNNECGVAHAIESYVL